MRRALVLACLIGCGRVGFDARPDDGGVSDGDADAAATTDAPSACLAFGPWGTPVNDPVLNTSSTDWGPSLSHDGLTLVFASDRLGAGSALFRTTRATTTSPWTTPTHIAEIGGGAGDPSLSADGLELYWGNPGVSKATRPGTGATFSPVGQPFVSNGTVSVVGGPDISPDGLTLVFTGTAMNDGLNHMYEVTRATTADAWGPIKSPPGLAQLGGEQFGSYRGDLLEVVFNKVTVGQYDLFAATRTTPTSAFGAATAVVEINSNDSDVDPDLSDDGTTLFFSSQRPPSIGSSWDLWYATRSCL